MIDIIRNATQVTREKRLSSCGKKWNITLSAVYRYRNIQKIFAVNFDTTLKDHLSGNDFYVQVKKTLVDTMTRVFNTETLSLSKSIILLFIKEINNRIEEISENGDIQRVGNTTYYDVKQ